MQSLECVRKGSRCVCESEGDAVRCNRCSGATWSYPCTQPHKYIWAFLACLCIEWGKWCVWRGVKWIYGQIRNNKQSDVYLYLKALYSPKQFFFLPLSPNSYFYPPYLFFYVIGLPLPGLAQFCLTYFFSILTICLTYTNSSAPLSSLCFLTDLTLSLSLMNTIGFFFYSSPSAKIWLKSLT